MKGKRVAILGNPDGWYVKDLQRAAQAEIDVLSFRDIAAFSGDRCEVTCRLASDRTSVRYIVGDRTDYDRILVRSMPLGSLEQIVFRMNALHLVEQIGKAQDIRVVNAPRCLEIAIDKWLTLQHLKLHGIPTPTTYCCQTREDAMEKFQSLGRRCVVKPIFGGEGRGIMRVDDPDVAWRVFSTLEQLSAAIYLQEFCNSVGYDLRLLVVGEDVLTVKRFSESDWRTNVARGGKAEAFQATPQQIAIARKAAECIGGRIVGVDILPTQDGRDLVLELNAVPGWRATAAALGIDIARRVLDELLRDR